MNEEQLKSQLFTIRVWFEGQVEGQNRWRGKLHHVPSNTIRYFRDWDTLIPLIVDLLQAGQDPDEMKETDVET